MNNLLQIIEKIKIANRIHEAQLLATKNGEVTPYRRSVFEERIRKTQKEMKFKTQKIKFFFETEQLRGGFIPLFFFIKAT